MTGLELSPGAGGGRYPGLDVMALSPHWDAATTAVVAARMGPPPAIRFFTVAEVATASALCDRLLDQDEEVRVPVVESNRCEAGGEPDRRVALRRHAARR